MCVNIARVKKDTQKMKITWWSFLLLEVDTAEGEVICVSLSYRLFIFRKRLLYDVRKCIADIVEHLSILHLPYWRHLDKIP